MAVLEAPDSLGCFVEVGERLTQVHTLVNYTVNQDAVVEYAIQDPVMRDDQAPQVLMNPGPISPKLRKFSQMLNAAQEIFRILIRLVKSLPINRVIERRVKVASGARGDIELTTRHALAPPVSLWRA